MPVTDYLTVDGEVLAETRGGVDRDYLPDPLGSTAALLDDTQARTDAFAYWPYGEERTTGESTPFRYVGTLGYRSDASSGRVYVRARHYRPGLARWQTVDPLWPQERAYGYAEESPTSWVDPVGTYPQGGSQGIGRLRDALHPGTDQNRCGNCAWTIVWRWWHVRAHTERHAFIHCMSCCVLTMLDGDDCAWSMQNAQNSEDAFFSMISPVEEYTLDSLDAYERVATRLDACGQGVSAGREKLIPGASTYNHCFNRCNRYDPLRISIRSHRTGKTYYNFTPPPPYLPECDPRSYTMTINPGTGGCS